MRSGDDADHGPEGIADSGGDSRVDPRFGTYRRTRARRLRDELVEDHSPLAHFLAGRFANRGESRDDLVQVALVGLFKAVERFDPGRGLQFSTFA
ncbi:MAG TPA: sigma factor, partial [Acidimicrobiia bacterium]|nr:sigma factor [Acidimicrobiia bacterium]